MLVSRRFGAPLPGAGTVVRAQAVSSVAASVANIHAGVRTPSAKSEGLPATSAAAKAKLASDVDMTLERTRTRLFSLQAADGSYNTAFNSGPIMVALGSLMSTACRFQDPDGRAVINQLEATQNSDGSFSLNPGDPQSPAATMMAALALESLAKREPELAKDALAVSTKARAYLREDPNASTTLYAIVVNILSDLLTGTNEIKGLPLGFLKELATGYSDGSLSELAKIFGAAVMLLYIAQARRNGDLASAELIESLVSVDQLIGNLKAAQDADGSWGWTVFGSALAAIALSEYRTGEAEVAKGLEFLDGLRKVDIKAWTRGDAWDTGLIGLATQAIGGGDDAKSAKAVKAILAGQLRDGRYSFSIHGNLGDNDTTSTVLRMLCERYGHTKDASERSQLAKAIERAVRGLLAYQQSVGSWGAFTKYAGRQDPLEPPKNGSYSALYDVGSPDLTSRVARSLVAASATGALSGETDASVKTALGFVRSYLHDVQSTTDGTWWNRWTAGRISTFAFTVPALRKLGLGADDATFKNTRAFLLAHQNADGGWGETIDADRTPDARGRGPSTPMQTASAIVGLIGTCSDHEASDPALNKALQAAVAYLLKAEKNGMFTNGTPLYTILFKNDYYDADASTTCFVAGALSLYRDFVAMGPEKAMALSSL